MTIRKRPESKIDANGIINTIESSGANDRTKLAAALKEIKTKADIEKIRDALVSEIYSAAVSGDESSLRKKLSGYANQRVISLSRAGGGYNLLNTWMILKQVPSASALATSKKWKKLGYSPIPGAEPILIVSSGVSACKAKPESRPGGKWIRRVMPIAAECAKRGMTEGDMAETLGVSAGMFASYKYGSKKISREDYDKLAKAAGLKKGEYTPYDDWEKLFVWSNGGSRVVRLYDLSQTAPDSPDKRRPAIPPAQVEEGTFSKETLRDITRGLIEESGAELLDEKLTTPYAVAFAPETGEGTDRNMICRIDSQTENEDEKAFAALCGLCACTAIKNYNRQAALMDSLPAIANLAAYITALRYGVPCANVRECIESCGRGVARERFGAALDSALNIVAVVSTGFNMKINELATDRCYDDYFDLFVDRRTRQDKPETAKTPEGRDADTADASVVPEAVMQEENPSVMREEGAIGQETHTEEDTESIRVSEERDAGRPSAPEEPDELPDFDDLFFGR